MPVLIMIVCKHREDVLVLLDKESRCAVRELFEGAGHRSADPTHAFELRFTAAFSSALTFVLLDQLLCTKLCESLDQFHRNGFRVWKPDRALADFIARKLVLEGCE